jgi:hypothetical protein
LKKRTKKLLPFGVSSPAIEYATMQKSFASFLQKRRPFLAAALLATLVTPALAGPAPRLVPDRDVTIDYTVRPDGRPAVNVEVAVAAGGRLLHITSQDLPTTILVNRDTETASILLPLLRVYATIRIGKYDPERTILHDATFSRVGDRTINGRHCTDWRAVSHDGQAAACITPDGVILRGEATSDRKGELGRVEARRIVYGPLSSEMFQVPPHFQKSPFRLDPNGLPQ